jgi:hypothetical protein
MTLTDKAKAALLRNFRGHADEKGYTLRPEDNLVSGVELSTVAPDLERGDGGELHTKFRAVHSSAALAVNSFGIFKDTVRRESLVLNGRRGATEVCFERRLTIFRGGRPPNLDVWIERQPDIVAIESKLLEYLTPTLPQFSDAYGRLVPPVSEPCWWAAYERSRTCGRQFLDRAQLVKHYFGLSAHLHRKNGDGRPATLLYLFWEPLNWQDFEECRRHREEVNAFDDEVTGGRVSFRWMTYNQLWDEWSRVPELAEHVANLKARYEVSLKTTTSQRELRSEE